MAKNNSFDELFAGATKKSFSIKTEGLPKQIEEEPTTVKENPAPIETVKQADKEMRFTIRLKKSTYDELKKQADVEDDSLNHLIVKAIKFYISSQNVQIEQN